MQSTSQGLELPEQVSAQEVGLTLIITFLDLSSVSLCFSRIRKTKEKIRYDL